MNNELLRELLADFNSKPEGLVQHAKVMISMRLIAEMKKSGMTAEEVGRKAECSFVLVDEIINADCNHRVDTIARVLFAAGMRHPEAKP